MSGSAGIRGYIIQTISCVLDVLCNDDLWEAVVLEPNDVSEKVDVLWIYPDKKRAVQVKSSQNQISLSDTQKWCSEIAELVHADEYELVLVGPCAKSVVDLCLYKNVKIPTPLSLNINALIEQASHRLAKYLYAHELDEKNPLAREVLVYAIIAKLATFSTEGNPLRRSDLDSLLLEWIQNVDIENKFKAKYDQHYRRHIDTWKAELLGVQYLNVPRILTALALHGDINDRRLENLSSVRTLRDADFQQFHTIMRSARELLRMWKPDVLSLGLGGSLKVELIGSRIGFDQLQFRSKNIPSWDSILSKENKITGNINKDPQIYYMKGTQKVVLPLDTSWITTGTAYGDFKYQRSYTSYLTGFGILKHASSNLAIITPLVLGIPDYMSLMGIPEG